nr:PilC/PilY family type IV pilus protein [Salinicola halophyticus]
MSSRSWLLGFTLSLLISSAMAADELAHVIPPGTQTDAKPRSMIVMSNDHQWFAKAYSDWSDIDGDGIIDTTYKESIEYYGYFDSQGCYQYDDGLAGGAFERVGDASSESYACTGNKSWSGNLLNWATMSRIDVIRKALYGGKRYRDNTTESTILERAFLPMDKHSFSKILTDQSVINRNTPFNGDTLTFCNTTYHPREYIFSGSVTSDKSPPLIRVATGNESSDKIGWPRWGNTETWQCPWRDERSNWSDFPYRDDAGSFEYRARVAVCDDPIGEDREDCRRYPGSAYAKPTGLLHRYAGDIEFGLFTGSYQNNKRGGVLRANFADFDREIADTGIFNYHDPDFGVNHNGGIQSGIVSNLDALRIARYSYERGFYDHNPGGDECPYGRTGPFANGKCSNWGNPLAEIGLESLRYIAGEPLPTTDFSVGEGDVEEKFIAGLTSPKWSNSTNDKWCAVNSMLLINGSEISYDSDDLDQANASLVSAAGITSETDAIGRAEGLGGRYFVGQTAASAGTGTDKYCTAKTIGGLSNVRGICPTAPGLEGSYNIAGLAKFAHDHTVIRSGDGRAGRKIDTYAVQLASNVPVVTIPGQGVSIIPACVNTQKIDPASGSAGPPGVKGRCAIVDFQVSQAADGQSGYFDATWEDSEAGGDYDLDVKVRINYDVEGERLHMTTRILQAAASETLGLGYVLSGTNGRYGVESRAGQIVVNDSDGFNVHQGINQYWNDYPESMCPRSAPCSSWDASSAAYRIGGSGQGQSLRPPLFYAAKYGNAAGADAYFEVNRIGDLAGQLQALLDDVIASRSRSGAGGAMGYEGDIDGSLFQTFYNYDNDTGWAGDVRQFKVDDDGRVTSGWSAQDRLSANPGDRQLIFRNTGGRGVEFSESTLMADGTLDRAQITALIAHYDKGKLGDIVGSTPALAGVPNTYYVPEDNDVSYTDFRTQYRNRNAMLYVGGNDGMLHAFDAKTGRERFGYIPGLLLSQLPELIDSDYQHRYYVDGSATVLDVRGDSGNWQSLLAIGLGSGGAGLFTLDVTNPASFSAAHAGAIAHWEYGPQDDIAAFGGPAQIGHIYDKPNIVQLENGRFAVVVGNGYQNAAGKASLYLLYAQGPGDEPWQAKRDVERLVPSGQTVGGNGMMAVSMVDIDGNGRVDHAYGADFRGSIWRFDLSADTVWRAPDKPIFTSNPGQVLTSPLEIARHPQGGVMLFFGTGARPESGVDTSRASDSFYAVRDNPLTSSALIETLTPKQLGAPRILSGPEQATDGTGVPIRYLETVSQDSYPENGWWLEFGGSERAISGVTVRGNRVLFTTLIPGSGTCDAIDSGYLYEMNAWFGSAFAFPVLDINDDGEVDAKDVYVDDDLRRVPVARMTSQAMQLPHVMVSDDGSKEFKIGVDALGGQQVVTESPLNRLRLGRVTWRVLE